MPDLDEYEYWQEIPQLNIDDDLMWIGISAHGGGTIGRSYGQNGWDYIVTVGDEPIITGDDMRSGAPATHNEMAKTLCSFLSAAGESLRYSDTSQYHEEYSESQRQFLIAQYERLTMFEMEE